MALFATALLLVSCKDEDQSGDWAAQQSAQLRYENTRLRRDVERLEQKLADLKDQIATEESRQRMDELKRLAEESDASRDARRAETRRLLEQSEAILRELKGE